MTLSNLSRLAGMCRIGCWLYIVSAPLVMIWYLFGSSGNAMIIAALDHPLRFDRVASWQWLWVKLVTILPSLILIAGVFALEKTFAAFQRGTYFSLTNVNYIKRFSVYLLLNAILSSLVFTLALLILSISQSPGEKILSFRFGSAEIKMIFIAAAFWLIAWVIEQGEAIEQENRQFI